MGIKFESAPKPKKIVKPGISFAHILQKEISFNKAASITKFKDVFYGRLSILLEAGVELKIALQIVGNGTKNKKHKAYISTLSSLISEGESLEKSLREVGIFSNYEIYSIRNGEETGTLSQITKELALYYSNKINQRRKLKSALTYPSIVLTTALLVVLFMMNFVVPLFNDIFKQQGVELPYITELIVSISEVIKDYFWYFFFGIPLLYIGFKQLFKIESYKRAKDYFLLRIPFLGRFYQLLYMSRFSQAIAMLSLSQVTISKSIRFTSEMIDFYPLRDALVYAEASLVKGDLLSQIMLKYPKVFDEDMVALVSVGEETNKMGYVFNKLYHIYANKLEEETKRLTSLLEPVIILFVGIFVGIILIAMYIPMFKLSNVIG